MLMSADHYFSKDPASSFEEKDITVELAGERVSVTTAGGIFSPNQLDPGTKVLLEKISLAPTSGTILDIGCGWGPISLALARKSPDAKVIALDVNQRALELTRKNARALGLSSISTATPDEVPEGEFSGIWSNPPIRVGKNELHEMLLRWIPRLAKGASAYLVVQKNLGSDSLQKWLNSNLPKTFEVSRLDSVRSYRILEIKNRP